MDYKSFGMHLFEGFRFGYTTTNSIRFITQLDPIWTQKKQIIINTDDIPIVTYLKYILVHRNTKF